MTISDKMWDWVDDFLEASGGIIGVIMGFVAPLVSLGLAIWALTHA